MTSFTARGDAKMYWKSQLLHPNGPISITEEVRQARPGLLGQSSVQLFFTILADTFHHPQNYKVGRGPERPSSSTHQSYDSIMCSYKRKRCFGNCRRKHWRLSFSAKGWFCSVQIPHPGREQFQTKKPTLLICCKHRCVTGIPINGNALGWANAVTMVLWLSPCNPAALLFD